MFADAFLSPVLRPKAERERCSPIYHSGTLYAASLLRNSGISVAVSTRCSTIRKRNFRLRSTGTSRESSWCTKTISISCPRCVSRECGTWPTRFLRHRSEQGATVLVNGSDSSDHRFRVPAGGFRCVLLGEAEWNLLEAVTHFCGVRGGFRASCRAWHIAQEGNAGGCENRLAHPDAGPGPSAVSVPRSDRRRPNIGMHGDRSMDTSR